MYAKIKELADEAIALQNKLRMEVALRDISWLCKCAMEGNDEGLKLGVGTMTEASITAALAAAHPGDTVQATGISDGAGNEKMLDVKVTPAAKPERHTGLDSPIVTAILADADRPKPKSVLKREAKKGGAK